MVYLVLVYLFVGACFSCATWQKVVNDPANKQFLDGELFKAGQKQVVTVFALTTFFVFFTLSWPLFELLGIAKFWINRLSVHQGKPIEAGKPTAAKRFKLFKVTVAVKQRMTYHIIAESEQDAENANYLMLDKWGDLCKEQRVKSVEEVEELQEAKEGSFLFYPDENGDYINTLNEVEFYKKVAQLCAAPEG